MPVSSDYDAEFARAADLLEAGQLAEAEAVFSEISRKSGQPAWQARAVLALAAADLSRKDFGSAIGRLKTADVSAIGLEPYRKILLARAFEGAGRAREEAGQYRAAFQAEEPFALRVEAGRALAEILEKQKDFREASAVLARAASLSGPAPGVSLALARLRVALALKDTATIRAAARDLLFARAPERELSAPVRRALLEEEARLSPADRGRLARAAAASGDMRRAVRLFGEFRPRLWPKDDRISWPWPAPMRAWDAPSRRRATPPGCPATARRPTSRRASFARISSGSALPAPPRRRATPTASPRPWRTSR